MGVGDLDGDGRPDVLTPFGWFGGVNAGKDRWTWHPDWQLGRTGFYDPIGLFFYRLDPASGAFVRHVIALNGTAGVGMRIVTADFDRDGDADMAVAGTTGLHLVENLRIDCVLPSVHETETLMERKWPFPDESDPPPDRIVAAPPSRPK